MLLVIIDGLHLLHILSLMQFPATAVNLFQFTINAEEVVEHAIFTEAVNNFVHWIAGVTIGVAQLED